MQINKDGVEVNIDYEGRNQRGEDVSPGSALKSKGVEKKGGAHNNKNENLLT